MKILMLSWRDPKHPLAGGAEQVVHEHAKGWINAGHHVTLFASNFKGASKKENLDGVEIIRSGRQILGVHINAFFWYLFKSNEKYDIVIDQFHGIPFFTPLYVKSKKLALIQEIAREVWFLNHLPFPFNYLIGVLGYILEPFIFILYKQTPFMTGSDSAKKDLVKVGIPEKNITVIPHGVIFDQPDKKFPKEKIKTIIFLGALAKDKGVEDGLKTFSLLKGNYKFWIVGKGSPEYTKHLKQICKKYLLDNVSFYGYVNQKKKFELLQRAHVLVNPSIREGWGLVNIEANCVETPVVAYSSKGLVDSVRNNLSGKLCKENTPQELARLIVEVLNSKESYKKLQKGALYWSKQFSWDKSIKRSLELLNSLDKIN